MEQNNLSVVVTEKTPALIKWNYPELKQGITKALKKYDGLVVTEENVKECKKMRADLNNKSKLLNSYKIDVKKEILVSYEQFETEIKEIMGLIDEQSKALDIQIKAIEDVNKIEEPTFNVSYQLTLTSKQMIKLEEYLNKQGIEWTK